MYVGQFLLVFAEDGATLALQSLGETLPPHLGCKPMNLDEPRRAARCCAVLRVAAWPRCVVAVQMSGARGAGTRKLGGRLGVEYLEYLGILG